jgi:hypothetical protein
LVIAQIQQHCRLALFELTLLQRLSKYALFVFLRLMFNTNRAHLKSSCLTKSWLEPSLLLAPVLLTGWKESQKNQKLHP